MNIFLKATAVVLVTVVLHLILSKKDKDISMLLTTAACCMILISAAVYLEPVVSFFGQLRQLADLNSEMVSILLKSVGIGLITEIAALICADVGNAALGKSLQIMATAVILWISLPLLSGLLELVGEILGEI